MSLFIRVDLGFYTHRKTLRLAARIGDSAYWVPPRLWAYAALQQPDGVFEGYSAEEIAMLIGYTKDASSMLQALLQAGFMDENPLRIHQWMEYNGFHVVFSERARKAARARWGEERERTKEKVTEITEKRGEEKYQASLSNAASNATSIKKPSRFAPPTQKEAEEYAQSISLSEEGCKAWMDHFTGNGWMTGRVPVKDWKATMRTWKRNQSKYENNGRSNVRATGTTSVAEERNKFIVGAEETKRAIAEESERRKREPQPWDNLP